MAVAVMEESWKESRRHVVECDLKSFFDTVNHDRLMGALREKVRCHKTLGLIRSFLTAGVVLPQDGPLSKLLENIALDPLDPLDKELEVRGHKFARYADDFIVKVKSASASKRVMASLIRYCEGRLQLIVNRAGNRAAPLKSCAFLSYRLNARANLVTVKSKPWRSECGSGLPPSLHYFPEERNAFSYAQSGAEGIRRRVRLYDWKPA